MPSSSSSWPPVLTLVEQGEETQENPGYQQWASYAPGTSVTMKLKTKTGENTMEMTMVMPLRSVGKDELVLETSSTLLLAGQRIEQPAREEKVPARVPAVPTRQLQDGTKPKTGEETLEVAGNKLSCKWIKTFLEYGETRTTSTIWTSDKVPGHLVRMESTTTGPTPSTTAQTLTAYTIK